MRMLIVIAVATWTSLFLTPDQRGQRYFQRGDYAQAAEAFRDTSWQGVAWYRAGEFEKAAQAFARRDTPEAYYNQGNAWLMNGQYATAIRCYDQALRMRSEWKEAAENRALALARAERVKRIGGDEGGDMGEEEGRPDQVSFDKKSGKGAQEEEIAGGEALSDQQIQALWLRRVQTRPADFLRAKFAYQEAMASGGAE